MAKSLENMTLEELEIEKKNAIVSMDSLRYKQVCDALGLITPDVPDLYEEGEKEEDYLICLALEQEGKSEEKTGLVGEVKKTRTNTDYSPFLNDWQRLNINERDYAADCDKKRKSLLRFYKFGENGKQPILNYSCEQIGHLYANILEQAKKSRGQ